MPDDLHLSPAETARRFGVSIKALRLYEQRGLLAPLRTRNGSTGAAWRVYGPDQVARLHQILALKRLGLPLARIAELLSGPDRLEAILALQEQALMRDSEALSRALALVRAARVKLASGNALSIDDLAHLTKETVMPNLTEEERMELLKPISAKYFTPEDAAKLKQRKYDQPAVTAQWNELFAQAKAFAAANADPASPPVQDLARRWQALIAQFTGGDEAMANKVRSVWKDAMNDPKLAPLIPWTPQIAAYMKKAQEHLKSAK